MRQETGIQYIVYSEKVIGDNFWKNTAHSQRRFPVRVQDMATNFHRVAAPSVPF